MSDAVARPTEGVTSGLERSPVVTAVGLAVAFVVVSVGSTVALGALAPGLEGKARDLLVELFLAVFVIGLIAALGWWRGVGFTSPGQWRHMALLLLPFLLTLLPFIGGIGGVDPATLVILPLGYALNSVAEDGMFRGILPRVLRSKGLIWTIVMSSLLFGLVHFGNLVSRPDQSAAITAAQALGAFTESIGLTAVRLATNTIVPVMLVHFLADLFGQLGGFPIVLAHVISSILMLVYGVWVYRRYRASMQDALDAD